MARTIYFPDGSMEVLFHPDDDTDGLLSDLERIIRERLGNDTAALLREVVHPADVKAYEQELDSYSSSIESYRACLEEVHDSLADLNTLINLTPRKATRAKIQQVLIAQIKAINNEM